MPPPPARFVIVGEGRTGTSYLGKLLDGHPQIACHGELFHGPGMPYRPPGMRKPEREALQAELARLRERDPVAFLERIFVPVGGRAIVGFKMFAKHNPKMLTHIISDTTIRKVVLFRANALARYASLLLAKASSEWSNEKRASQPTPPISFDPVAFKAEYESYFAFIDSTLSALARTVQPFHVIRYAEMNSASMIAALLRFLGTGVEPFALPSAPVRSSPDIVSRFANPNDVEAFLRQNSLMHWAYEGDVSFVPLGHQGLPP